MRGSIRWLFRSIGVGSTAVLCAAACGGSGDVDFSSTDGGGSSGKQSSGGSSGKGSGGGGASGNSGSGGSATGGAAGSSSTGGSGGGSGGAGATGGASSGGSTSTGGSAGSTGSGGSTSSGGSGGSGVGGGPDGGTCPPTQPSSGSECKPDDLSCNYGDPCCPTIATCSNGHWLVAVPACVAPVCPDNPPEHGNACERCRVPAECSYDRCSGDALYTARCSAGGTWNVTSTPCKFACGDAGLECKHDEVCVKTEGGGPGVQHSCETNPCGSQPVSCSCADSLCSTPATCSPAGTGGSDVACVCLVCN